MIQINKRSIVVCILLSIITFGIYGIYWLYLLVKNTRSIQKNTTSCTGEMLCLIFVPFYSLYWWYTRGEKVKQEFSQHNYASTGNGIVYLIFAIFGLSIVSMAIMQSDFNSLKSETHSEQRSAMKTNEVLLDVRDVEVYYGVIRALKGVSLHVNKGEVVALIGANGAGKTTMLHTITGLVPAKSGSIVYDGHELTTMPAHKILPLGMAHVPEGRRIFQQLSVYDNLKLGAYTVKNKAQIEENLRYVYKHFPRLEERKKQVSGTLSGGEQQMLAMGRALMSNPKIILMDEPSMGLSPLLVTEIFQIIKEVSRDGTTVLLVEQNAKKALAIADRAYVLETGSISLEGNAVELINDEQVKKAYLGE